MNLLKMKIWERIVPLSKATRTWDIEFWQAQEASVRFQATWDMVLDFYRMKKGKINGDTPRLQRSIENIKRA